MKWLQALLTPKSMIDLDRRADAQRAARVKLNSAGQAYAEADNRGRVN
jgi:hypothetical protein